MQSCLLGLFTHPFHQLRTARHPTVVVVVMVLDGLLVLLLKLGSNLLRYLLHGAEHKWQAREVHLAQEHQGTQIACNSARPHPTPQAGVPHPTSYTQDNLYTSPASPPLPLLRSSTYLCQLLHGPLVHSVPAHRDGANRHSRTTARYSILRRRTLSRGSGRGWRGVPLSN